MIRFDLLAPRLPKRWLIAVAGVAATAVVGLGGMWIYHAGFAPDPNARAAIDAAARRAEHEAFTAALDQREERTLQVARGESLALVLSRAEARWDEIGPMVSAVSAVYDPRRLRPGQDIQVYVEPDGDKVRLTGLAFRADPGAAITVGRNIGGQFWAKEVITPWSLETSHFTSPIAGSLYQTALNGGATEKEVAVISDVLSYDVDFQRDVFAGDSFEMLFDRYYDEDGRTIRTGDLYFIALDTRRGPKAYYFFDGPNDTEGAWYDKDGKSAKKFLMKTPIDGARMSSTYGVRVHPVLGYSMMHRGTDFAAGAGTPIRAAGDGKVVRAGPFGSFGNYIRLRHANGYDTAYAHMSRFAAGMKPGASVRQGQVIGYVGATGRVTGPHLHYEVLVKNAQVNPATLKLQTGRNLSGQELALFQIERERIDALRAKPEAVAPMMASAGASAAGSVELRGGLE
jgi:murein DD-endopeptidase MepM/ murein hydrolase activator NlpD